MVFERGTGVFREVEEVRQAQEGEVVWVHLEAPDAAEVERVLGGVFGAHRLAVRVAGERGDRPRLQRFRDHAFLGFLAFDEQLEGLQIGVLVGESHVVTVTDAKWKGVRTLQKRMREALPELMEPGYLLYLLLDTLVEEYLHQIDEIVSEMQGIEQRVFVHPFENETGKRIFRWKRDLHRMRLVVEEEHSIVELLAAPDFPFKSEEVQFYLEDLQHSYGRVVGAFDQLKEATTAVFDLQMSLKSDHMNVIMKTLTLFSAMFLPLTFLTGVYGTNFEYLPELTWKYSYFVLWGVMITIASSLFLYFKKKGWF